MNLKQRAKLMIVFVITSVIPLMVMSMVNISSSIAGMTAIEEKLYTNQLKSDIAAARIYIDQYYGRLTFEGNQIVDQEGKSITEAHQMIDQFSKDLGVQATIFIKAGNDYKRIISSIVDEQGKSVEGTMLSNDIIASEMANGNSYSGDAKILGHDYLTIYEPLKDDAGQVFGILFVGISKAESSQTIKANIQGLTRSSIITLIIIIVVGTIIMIVVANMITKPLTQLVEHSNIISTYNLKEDIPKNLVNRRDEIGMLARGLQKIEDRR